MRKEVSEKPVQTIIPRNELITEQPEMRPSPRAVIGEGSSRLSLIGPLCRKQARESSIQRKWGTEKGKVRIPNASKVECSPELVFGSEVTRRLKYSQSGQ